MDLRGPKGKIARRLGIALSPKTAKILERRPTPPGQHGAARPGKMSEYKRQLTEKQRLRAQYNLSERQLRIAFARAGRLGGNTGERLLQLLERRLDATVYRAGLAPTIFAARQLVAHGHVLVDGRRCDIPSYLVHVGDVIRAKNRQKSLQAVQAVVAEFHRDIPDFLSRVEGGVPEGRVNRLPTAEDVSLGGIQSNLIVELCSK